MKHSKVLRLLQMFRADEVFSLRQSLRSPVLNTNPNVTALFEFLWSFAPDFDAAAMTTEAAFDDIFPEKPDHPDKREVIVKLSSKLLSVLLSHVERRMLEDNVFTALTLRRKWFERRGASEWEAATLHEMSGFLEKYPYRDEFHASGLYEVEIARLRWEASSHLVADKLSLHGLNHSLDASYLRAKLECLCHALNHALISRQVYALEELTWVESLLILHREHLPATTLMWYDALCLLRDPANPDAYQRFKQAVLEHHELLPLLEKRTMIHYLTNCARHAFGNPDAYSREIFSLYKLQSDYNILLINGYIGPELFYNIIATALYLRELEWAEGFFDRYGEKLNPASEKSLDMHALCRSIIAFEKGSYGEALDLLNNTRFRDIQCKLSEKRMRLKIYCELGMADLFDDHCNAFRKFLSVNSKLIARHHLEGNRNFINLASAIHRATEPGGALPEKTRRQIRDSAIVPERNWLMGRMM